MVSQAEVWDPFHAGTLLSQLNEQRLAGPAPFCDVTLIASDDAKFRAHQSVLAACSPYFRELLSSPSPASSPAPSKSALPRKDRVLELPHLQSRVLSDLLDYIYTSRVSQHGSRGTQQLSEAGRSLGVPFLAGLVGKDSSLIKSKIRQDKPDRMEGIEKVGITKSSKTYFSVPLSVPFPDLPAQNHSPPTHSPSSSSACITDPEETSWKLVAKVDKKIQHTPGHLPTSSSSSSSTPIDLTAPTKKDPPSTSPTSVTGTVPQFMSLPLLSASRTGLVFPAGGKGDSFPAGMDSECSTTETAQILYNLSAMAFQGQGALEPDRNECGSGVKQGRTESPSTGPSLPKPNPLPPPLSPPPPNDSSSVSSEPELLCGVCHRLFSSASSLTVHMRLHRGGRALSCRHCGKAFIHNKRLQSHEAVCRHASPALHAPTKQEPPEELEESEQGGGEGGQPEQGRMGPGRPLKKGRPFLGRHHRTFSRADLLAEEDHFVKVVDGHIIYFCTVCERSYMTLSSLKRHSNVHSWRRKYPCHFCDKVFALAEYRTKHEVWHTGERRYQCIFCWEAFATYYNLKTHQKAFHGISPGLISSEKTANGGYKQKLNALKLYRLLPMRSQKRPYKTYSQSLTDSLLLAPESAKPLSLPLDCSLPTPLGPSELHSLINESHPPDLLADTNKFTFGVNTDSIGMGETSKLTDAMSEVQLRMSKEEESDGEQAGSSRGSILPGSSNIQLPRDYCGPKAPVSSVITYGHPKPSVIKHGTAVSSSVIVHSNQISSGADRNILNSSSTLDNSQLPSKAAHRPMKKQVLKNYVQSQKEGEGVSTPEKVGDKQKVPREEKVKPQKGRRAHNKGVTYTAKPACVAGVAEIRGSAPLCQITVRIGEEAIVKRSISETDLMRDKNLSPSKAKRTDTSSPDPTETYTHSHHHHHRHRLHHSPSEQEEGETWRKSPKAPKMAKVREYYFRQEVREEESDQDAEDNLWRPYYTYKPKRKSLHVQKVKKSTWQRQLRYKRSLRLIKRTERLTDHSIKEGEEDEEEEEEMEGGLVKKERTDGHEESSNTSSVFSTGKQKQDITEENETQCRIQTNKSLMEVSSNCTSRQEPHQTMKRASECGTCGRWFSTVRKRDRHEVTHLQEFVCLKCHESFPSQDKLDEHQRTQHVQVEHILSLSQNQPVDTHVDMVLETEVQKAVPGKGSPGRVGRRPSVRHICPHCGKVCKTAAALGRHTKRHEVDSPTVDGEDACGTIAPVTEALSTASAEQSSTDLNAKNDNAQAIPVINYPKVAPQSVHDIESQGHNFSREGKAELQTLGPFDDSEHKDKGPTAARNPSPQYSELPQTSPSSRLERLEASSTGLHSVLVLSRKDTLDPTSYKIFRERSAEGQISCKSSSVQIEEANDTTVRGTMRLQGKANVEIAGPLTAVHSGGEGSQCRLTAETKTDGTPSQVPMRLPAEEEPQVAQNLRLPAISRSSSTVHAQDLTVASIIRERELSHSATGKVKVHKEQQRDRETTLLVPKQEVETPTPSPEYSIIQSPASSVSHRHSKSPHRSPNASDMLARAHLEAPSSMHSKRGSERQGLQLPSCSSGVNEHASANVLLHSRLPQSQTDPDEDPSSATTGPCGEAKYPVQEFPLPLIMPGGCRSSKKHEDNILVSYPANPLPFGPLGKMGGNGDLTKLPFYPDPYHLLYSPQLLAYPYNLAALPMALNMMAPEEKVEPLPFLPALFNYAAGPYAGMVPHPLVANPSHYSNSSGNNKKRDSTNP